MKHAPRLEVVDLARGLAVVGMLVMHTGDGWLARSAQTGFTWEVIRLVGGMAAPLFLLISGISLGIAWSGSGPLARLRVGLGRGVELVLLGYALRVQMWMLDAGGYRFGWAWVVAGLLLGGYGLLFVGARRWARGRNAGWTAAIAAALIGVGVIMVSYWIPARMAGILRVDVLQCIGGSVALVSVAAAGLERGRVPRRWWAPAAAGAALVVGLATPALRAWAPGPLPGPIVGYLADWRPAPGALPAGLFPLFPWLAYVLVGAIVGMRWGEEARVGRGGAAVARAAFVGALLAFASCEVLPPVFAFLERAPWLVQTFRVAYRVGLGLVAIGLCLVAGRFAGSRAVLGLLGRASLVVYWVHLELVYGVVGRPLAHGLSTAAWSGAASVLCVLMIALSVGWAAMQRRSEKHGNSEQASAELGPLRPSPREAL